MALDRERLRALLEELVDHVRAEVLAGRDRTGAGAPGPDRSLAAVTGATPADTIYRIDRFGDEALVEWFAARWPRDVPVEIVAEGLPGDGSTTVHAGTAAPAFTCIVDPIDGTRMLMHDKRSAWVLAAIAPRTDRRPRLCDVEVAAMAELPPTKQRLADRFSAVRGLGPRGVRGTRTDLDSGATTPVVASPSRATDLRHGFAAFAHFFPEGKALLAAFEEELWAELHRDGEGATDAWLPVFDDQYLATGGQVHEVLVGHDRVAGDLRPLAFAELGLDRAMTAHPYDACTVLLLTEAGGVVTDPWGDPLDAPLDTTSPVAWVGYANPELAERIAPVVARVAARRFPTAAARRTP